MAPSKKSKAQNKPKNSPSLKNRFFTKREKKTVKAKEHMQKLRATEDEASSTQRRQDDAVRHSEKRSTEDEATSAQRRQESAERMSKQRSTEDDAARNERLTQFKQRYRRSSSRDWRDELADKASLKYICTSEYRRRTKASSVLLNPNSLKKAWTDKQLKLLIINEDTRSLDGNHYVCKPCATYIKNGKIPPLNEVTYKFRIPPLPSYLQTPAMELSQLEDHLLKLVIPYIRIMHLPGSGQHKVKGGMITVEAEVKKTIEENILPRNQELIPVSFKRKPTYKGNVMQEIVSKSKVEAYFKFFKEHNPLFRDEHLDQERIDDVIRELTSDGVIQIEHEEDDCCQHGDGTSTHHDQGMTEAIRPVEATNCLTTDVEHNTEVGARRESNNEDASGELEYATVLETFYQKTDKGNGICDRIADAILTQEVNDNTRLIVAPTAAGNFVNLETVDLEERAFPKLFTRGTGGYLSSYAPKGVQFSNYIKIRLLGGDWRFVKDERYICFLFHVKEALEIKRSRVTYFRKCKMNRTKYNKSSLKDLTKGALERSDLEFKAFKNVRGTTPYFEAKKKELFSMIRQLGSPHIFFTKSINEIGMLDMIKELKEIDSGSLITHEEVMDMSNAERNRLIKKYPVDVVNHVDARFRHHISTLKKHCSLGEFAVEDFFLSCRIPAKRKCTHSLPILVD